MQPMVASLRSRLPILATLLLAAVLLLVALSHSSRLDIGVGTPADAPFVGGFFAPELSDGTPFRWSNPDSQLTLHGLGAAPAILQLRMTGATTSAPC